MTRDRLFLLRPGFEDPAYPGRSFYCWHCALIEGVLASFPLLAEKLDIERIGPRTQRTVEETQRCVRDTSAVAKRGKIGIARRPCRLAYSLRQPARKIRS